MTRIAGIIPKTYCTQNPSTDLNADANIMSSSIFGSFDTHMKRVVQQQNNKNLLNKRYSKKTKSAGTRLCMFMHCSRGVRLSAPPPS